jgi:hypothetical protein
MLATLALSATVGRLVGYGPLSGLRGNVEKSAKASRGWEQGDEFQDRCSPAPPDAASEDRLDLTLWVVSVASVTNSF